MVGRKLLFAVLILLSLASIIFIKYQSKPTYLPSNIILPSSCTPQPPTLSTTHTIIGSTNHSLHGQALLPQPNAFTCGVENWQHHYSQFHLNTLQEIFTRKDSQRFLIYECTTQCSGLGDRLVGLISAALLAVLTDRALLIHMPAPFPWSEVFVPNMIDWRMPQERGVPDFLQGLTTETLDVFCKFENGETRDLFAQHDLTGEWMKDVQVIKYIGNERFYHLMLENPKLIQKLKALGMDRMDKFNLFACFFSFLFKPSPSLQLEMDRVYNEYFLWKENGTTGRNVMICLHLRTGVGLKEKIRMSPEQVAYYWKCAESIELSLKEQRQRVKWYLATDDDRLKKEVTDLLKGKVVALQSEAKHISTNSLDKKDFLSIMTDWALLTMCDHYVISRSGFAETANMVAQKPRWKFPMDCKQPPRFEFYHPEQDSWG